MYSFRQSIPIVGMIVYVFETPCKLWFGYVLPVIMLCCHIVDHSYYDLRITTTWFIYTCA